MAGIPRLIEILRQEQVVSAQALDRAVAEREQRGVPLAEALIVSGAIEEEDLFFLMSRRLDVPTIPEERLLHLTIAPDLRRRVPRRLAEQFVLLPLDLDLTGRLSVAMLDPSDPQVLAELCRSAGAMDVRAYLARRSAIIGAFDNVYTAEEDTLAPSMASDQWKQIDPGDTQVEVIPGKVSLEKSLVREIARVAPELAEPPSLTKEPAQPDPQSSDPQNPDTSPDSKPRLREQQPDAWAAATALSSPIDRVEQPPARISTRPGIGSLEADLVSLQARSLIRGEQGQPQAARRPRERVDPTRVPEGADRTADWGGRGGQDPGATLARGRGHRRTASNTL